MALRGSAVALAAALAAACGDATGPARAVEGLAFVRQPDTAVAGAPFAPPVVVELRDAAGRVVTSAADSVTIALDSGPGGAQLLGTTQVAAVGGVARFDDLAIELAGSGYTLIVRADSLSAVSAPFDVVPAAPARLILRSQPSATPKGMPIAPPIEVAVEDSFGNLATNATIDITAGLGANPGTLLLHASGLTPGNRIVQLIDPVSFDVIPPLPNAPAGEVVGMVFDPATAQVLAIIDLLRLTVIDPATGMESPIDTLDVPELRALAVEAGTGRLLTAGPFSAELFALDATTATTQLLGALTLAGDSITGINALATDPGDGTLYGIVQTLGNANRRIRNLVTIDAATLTATNIGTLSENGVADLAFLPNGDLLAVTGDGAPNPETLWRVDKATATMTAIVALGLGDDGETIATIPAVLLGTVTVPAVDGLARFADLRIETPASGYTLVFSAPGVPPVTSDPFDITP